jgi:hypothetical protein
MQKALKQFSVHGGTRIKEGGEILGDYLEKYREKIELKIVPCLYRTCWASKAEFNGDPKPSRIQFEVSGLNPRELIPTSTQKP